MILLFAQVYLHRKSSPNSVDAQIVFLLKHEIVTIYMDYFSQQYKISCGNVRLHFWYFRKMILTNLFEWEIVVTRKVLNITSRLKKYTH